MPAACSCGPPTCTYIFAVGILVLVPWFTSWDIKTITLCTISQALIHINLLLTFPSTYFFLLDKEMCIMKTRMPSPQGFSVPVFTPAQSHSALSAWLSQVTNTFLYKWSQIQNKTKPEAPRTSTLLFQLLKYCFWGGRPLGDYDPPGSWYASLSTHPSLLDSAQILTGI